MTMLLQQTGNSMALLSIQFYIIIACLLVVYYLLPETGQWFLLLLAGFGFFMLTGTPYTVVYLLVSIISIYLAGRFVASGKYSQGNKKAVLIAAVILNVGMLAVLKYSDFFISGAQGLINIFGADVSLPSVQLVSSIGISYYTLQVTGYLCDVYWGTASVQKNPLKFALFAGYFPLLTSGPVCRYAQLEDKLYAKHHFNFENIAYGSQRILWGIAKKLIIAERLAPLVNAVFGSPGINGRFAPAAASAFVFQLYADFSGSIDIIMGISECFGIKLPENFKAPFFSRSIQEFWQRWHIALGTWFKDYVMFPVLRSRLWAKMGSALKGAGQKRTALKSAAGKKSPLRMVPSFLGMLILWLCIGLWHGGDFKYIMQGIWFWLVIVTGQVTTGFFAGLRKKINTPGRERIWHIFQSIRTFLLFAIGIVFFRAASLGNAFEVLGNIFWPARSAGTGNAGNAVSSFTELAGGAENLLIAALGVVIVLLADIFRHKGTSLRGYVGRQHIALRWALYYMLIFAVIFFGRYGGGYSPADFIYEGF